MSKYGYTVLIRARDNIDCRENRLCSDGELLINFLIVPSLLQCKQYVTHAGETGRSIQVVLAGSEDHVTD